MVECGDLANPRNGRVDLSGTTFGSTATYSCNQDYMLDGPRTRNCQADGSWSGREPTCERMSAIALLIMVLVALSPILSIHRIEEQKNS